MPAPAKMMNVFSVLCFICLSFSARGSSDITISVPSKVEEIDPVEIATTYEMIGTSSYCRPLTRVNERGEIEGELLRKWSISKDRKEYRFFLRKNLALHDGSILSAHDVAYSLSRFYWKKYQSGYRFHLAFLVGHTQLQKDGWLIPQINIVSDSEFIWKLEKPYLPILKLLSQTVFCIVKKNKPLIGTGPLKIDQKFKGTGWKLVKFEGYTDDVVHAKTLKVIPQFDLNKTLDDLKNGQVDLVIGNHLKNLDKDTKGQVGQLDFLSINHFLLNSDTKIFANKKRRKLFGRTLQAVAWKEENIPFAQSISKSIVPAGYFSNSITSPSVEIESLIKKVKGVNWTSFKPIEIKLVGRHFSESFFKDLSKTLNEVGIKHKLTILKGPKWSNIVVTKDYDVSHLPVRPALYDPDSLFLNLEDILSGKEKKGYSKAIEAVRHSSEKKKRMKQYLTIFQKIRDEWVVVPAYKLNSLYLKNENVILPDTKYKNEFQSWKIRKK